MTAPPLTRFAILLGSALALPAAADEPARYTLALDIQPTGLAVLYPDLAEPYRTVFTQIIQGIEEKSPAKVERLAIAAPNDTGAVSGELKQRGVKTVIALGRNGLKLANALGPDIAIVGGCVLEVPEEEAKNEVVLSLAPDPALLFNRLKSLAPSVARVFVVYDPAQTGWLVALAQKAGKAKGIEVVGRPVADLKAALLDYKDILAGIDPRRDAVWLPQDTTTVEESTVVPLLLQEAWNRQFVLFSSNIGYVRRGALFALYPDNKGLGHSLAALAAEVTAGQRRTGLLPLDDVLMGVNVRTADHLGLTLSKAEQQSFDLVFPER